tara:strand:+ start:387 stop:563 length:177 start_codon:yes stop_codon:yes gene_type:complete
MKAELSKEDYKEWVRRVDDLKQKHDIELPHSVKYLPGGKVEVKLLQTIDLKKLDELSE